MTKQQSDSVQHNMEKMRRLRLKKLAHWMKGIPINKKKECLSILHSYDEWNARMLALPEKSMERGAAMWERNYYWNHLKFVLHYAMTGDVLSRSGVITLGSPRLVSDDETRSYLEKRGEELMEIDKAIQAYGDSSDEEKQRFEKEVTQKGITLFSKKQVPDQLFGRKIEIRFDKKTLAILAKKRQDNQH